MPDPDDGASRHDWRPEQPFLPLQILSSGVMGVTGAASRAWLLAATAAPPTTPSTSKQPSASSNPLSAIRSYWSRWRSAHAFEVHGLPQFLALLDKRKDRSKRERGLLTVSNHVSVVDDPLVWGALPWRYHWRPENLRWGLASHDLCFTTKPTSAFFTAGQLLPTHRAHFSRHGGLFQPTATEAIRLLSKGPFKTPSSEPGQDRRWFVPATTFATTEHREEGHIADPFSTGLLVYTTTGADQFQVPSAFRSRDMSWVHVFPEGKILQSPNMEMRYFRWGVARMILESEPCPDLVPMWIEGPEQIMHESRTFPRFVPRAGKPVSITFGDTVNMRETFGDLRDRWRALVEGEAKRTGGQVPDVGIVAEGLRHADEAVALRIECARRVREEVIKLRRGRGWPEEDAKYGLAKTWRVEGGPEPSWEKEM